MVIYPQLKIQQPSLEALDRKIQQEFRRKQQCDGPEMLVSLKDPNRPESNPFGFIHYMDKPEELPASPRLKSRNSEERQKEMLSYKNDDK